MAECEIQSADGRIWTADEFALELGYTLDATAFAEFLQGQFRIHGYERMQHLWWLRDRSLKRNRSGSFPEGYNISKDII
jgi:hypothetical protein